MNCNLIIYVKKNVGETHNALVAAFIKPYDHPKHSFYGER